MEQAKAKTVRLRGEIDHHNAAKLRHDLDEMIKKERPTRLILDFSRVQMMDSSGIGLVIGRYKQMKKQGGEVWVTNLNRRVDTIFRLSGLYQIIKKG